MVRRLSRVVLVIAALTAAPASAAPMSSAPTDAAAPTNAPPPTQVPTSPISRPAPAARPSSTSRAPARLVPGRVLLKLAAFDEAMLKKADAGDASARAALEGAVRALPAARVVELRYTRRLLAGWALFSFASVDEDETEALVNALRAAPGVKGAAPDRWFRPLRRPNDEFFDLMWHLGPIGAEGGWDITVGSAGQTVGVVDTGTFRAHEDLAGKDAAGFDFVSTGRPNDGNGRDADYNDPGDGCGEVVDSFHGSHVAGTILANSNNGRGVAGLNWNARLVTSRVLGCDGGANSDIMEGLAWLAGFDIPLDPNDPDGPSVPPLATNLRPRVANMSLGGPGACDQFSEDVLQLVVDQGLIPVIAAGNDGGPVNSPANCPAAIAVGAYGPGVDNPLAAYSSFGPEIDVVAPGGDQEARGVFEDGVLSFYSNDISPPYTFLEGTSMAAPHVSGAVSLMLALNPTLSRDDVANALAATGDFCRGCDGKPALRIDAALIDVGDVVPTQPGDSCTGFCSPGQSCLDNICRVTCVSDGDCLSSEVCDPVDDVCLPDAGGGGTGGGGNTGGGGGGAGSGTLCDPRRGNMDCPNGEGCSPDPDGEGGECIRGLDDGDDQGALCRRDGDCASGLCDRGVCTVTCDLDDGDCLDGYECDDDAVPGGLCRPESCQDEDERFCERGWECSYSSEERYVCADEASNYLHCASGRLGRADALAALVVLGLVRRRRPRR